MDVIEDTTPAKVETKPVIDMTVIGALVAADMATRFGQTVDATPLEISKARLGDGVYASLAIAEDFGIFKMIMKTAKLSLRCEPLSDGTIWVHVDLSYDHVGGGSNGHTVCTYWVRDGQIENFRGA